MNFHSAKLTLNWKGSCHAFTQHIITQTYCSKRQQRQNAWSWIVPLFLLLASTWWCPWEASDQTVLYKMGCPKLLGFQHGPVLASLAISEWFFRQWPGQELWVLIPWSTRRWDNDWGQAVAHFWGKAARCLVALWYFSHLEASWSF